MINDCNYHEQKDMKKIHRDMLKKYKNFMNKGIYKYNINKNEYSEDIRKLVDMLGEED